MPRPISIALFAILFSASLYGQEAKKPSPAVKRVLDKAVAEVKKNRQEFDKANAKPLGEARQELQDLSTKLIKDGKTDEATAVLGQVKTLDTDVMKMANAPAPVGGAVRKKPLLERMAGDWTHPNHPTVWRIEPDGDFREFFKSDGKVLHQGRLEAIGEDTAECVFHDGRMKLSEAGVDTLAMLSWDTAGKPWNVGMVLTRVK